jgi:hypothetical protein
MTVFRDIVLIAAFVALIFVLAALAMHGMAVVVLSVIGWF